MQVNLSGMASRGDDMEYRISIWDVPINFFRGRSVNIYPDGQARFE